MLNAVLNGDYTVDERILLQADIIKDGEILKSFHDFKTIFVSDVCCLDLGPGKPHYHGVINYIGQKIN